VEVQSNKRAQNNGFNLIQLLSRFVLSLRLAQTAPITLHRLNQCYPDPSGFNIYKYSNALIFQYLLDNWLYRGYTINMKTAISLPDSLYEAAEKTAQSMGLPRSQLFAKALEEFIQHHNSERITEKLNDVYSHFDNSTGPVTFFV
jgi:hypothetical protein